jgi:hypothetical protein
MVDPTVGFGSSKSLLKLQVYIPKYLDIKNMLLT